MVRIRGLDAARGRAVVPSPGASLLGAGTGQEQARPYFTQADWLWSPIPSSPVLDPNSSAMANALSQGQHSLNCYDYAVRIVHPEQIDTSTPRYLINFTAGGGDPFNGDTMPIPNGTTVPPEQTTWGDPGDSHLAAYDDTTNKVYSLWQAVNSGGSWSASYGALSALNGDGRETSGSSTGAGVAHSGTAIRLADLARGEINHALAFSTDWAAPSSNFRYPATKSDGNGTGAAGEIPEGARVQLSPSFNVSSITHPFQRMVARALQVYGAYCVDNGGARMAFVGEFEGGTSPGPTWNSWGVSDYYNMTQIPWSQLRVLRNWDGS